MTDQTKCADLLNTGGIINSLTKYLEKMIGRYITHDLQNDKTFEI